MLQQSCPVHPREEEEEEEGDRYRLWPPLGQRCRWAVSERIATDALDSARELVIAMVKKSKAHIVYKADPAAKVAARLEEFLFGKPTNELFEADIAEDEEEAVMDAVATAGKDGDAPAFFMDTAGHESQLAVLSDDEEEDDDDDEDDEDKEEDGSSSGEEEDAGGEAREGQVAEEGSDAEAGSSGRSEDADDTTQPASEPHSRRKAAAWEDEDTRSIEVDVARGHSRLRAEYEEALRKQHSSMNGRTSWATANKRIRPPGSSGYGADSDEEEEEEEGAALLQQAGGLLASSRHGKLLPGTIEVTRMKDANQHEPHASVIQSLQFHTGGHPLLMTAGLDKKIRLFQSVVVRSLQFHTGGHPLLMTAGLDKKIRLFQVDGKRNPKVQSIHLEDCPVQQAAFANGGAQAAFANGGAQIIATGRRPHFYIYDLAASSVEKVLGPAGCPQKSLQAFAVAGGQLGGSDPLVAFQGDQVQFGAWTPLARGQFGCMDPLVARGQFGCMDPLVARGQFGCMDPLVARGQFGCNGTPHG
eukprot:gene57-12875_t